MISDMILSVNALSIRPTIHDVQGERKSRQLPPIFAEFGGDSHRTPRYYVVRITGRSCRSGRWLP